MSLKPTPGFQNVIYFDQTNLPQGDISGNSDLTAYTQFEHMKFCLDMHNIATDINSIPTRTTNISDSNYDTILHTHFKLVIKAYLMYTDENQDELLRQRQYLFYYRKLNSETWDLTYGCGMCGYRVQIQLELRAEYLRKSTVVQMKYRHAILTLLISWHKDNGRTCVLLLSISQTSAITW